MTKNLNFTEEDKLINHLVLHSIDIPNLGLLYGQMGICLVLACYGKKKKDKQLKKISEFLLNRIFSKLTENCSIAFAHGLSGIGWGVEYLIQNRIMTGNSIDICESIDNKIQQIDLANTDDLSLEAGLEGLLNYVLAHIHGTLETGCPFKRQFMDALYARLSFLLNSDVQKSVTLKKLSNTFMNIYVGETWEYHPDICEFIIPQIRIDKRFLGIRNGVAGLIYKKFIINETDFYR